MHIVIDTNVLISGVFFGGMPARVLSAVIEKKIVACATTEIVDEYMAIVSEMLERKQGHLKQDALSMLVNEMEIISPVSSIEVCRDPDDNKFIECAIDSKALYIVSGDNDLLVLERFKNIEIITAKEFCDKYLK